MKVLHQEARVFSRTHCSWMWMDTLFLKILLNKLQIRDGEVGSGVTNKSWWRKQECSGLLLVCVLTNFFSFWLYGFQISIWIGFFPLKSCSLPDYWHAPDGKKLRSWSQAVQYAKDKNFEDPPTRPTKPKPNKEDKSEAGRGRTIAVLILVTCQERREISRQCCHNMPQPFCPCPRLFALAFRLPSGMRAQWLWFAAVVGVAGCTPSLRDDTTCSIPETESLFCN